MTNQALENNMKEQESNSENGITRKQAMEKMGKFGKYAALTSLGTYILLSPKQAQAQSPEDPGTDF
ncbi:MAG: hypothetical protein WBG46_08185 [Nonlabens sp.]